jgi:hypothetical protein
VCRLEAAFGEKGGFKATASFPTPRQTPTITPAPHQPTSDHHQPLALKKTHNHHNTSVFGGDRIKGLMVAFQIEDLPMESQMLSDALDTAQKRVESYFYDIRKNLFDYDQARSCGVVWVWCGVVCVWCGVVWCCLFL